MELRHLRQIMEICHAGSFSSAAQRLGVSQPTLSKSVARLEAQLSVKLFDRDGGAARPTVYGLYVADRAAGVLGAVAALTHDVAQLANGGAGRLRIGVGSATKLKPLPGVIRQAADQFPHLRIETHHAEVDAILRSLKAGRYELAFCYAEGAEPYGSLMRIKIFEDRNAAAVRPGHPLLKETSLSAAKLLKYPIAGFPLNRKIQGWFGDISAEERNNLEAFVSDDHDLIKGRPTGTDYVALAPAFVFEKEFQDGSLVELAGVGLPKYECWMLTTRALWQLPIVKSMAEIALSTVAAPRA
jgi:DNA-binding transcriptional LysR family regulator